MVGRARGEGGGPACREGCVLGRFREAEPEDLLVPLNVRPRGLHLPGPRASWLKLRLQVSQPLNRTPRLRGPAGWRGSALRTLAPPWLIHSGLLWAGKGRVGLMCQEPQDHPPPTPTPGRAEGRWSGPQGAGWGCPFPFWGTRRRVCPRGWPAHLHGLWLRGLLCPLVPQLVPDAPMEGEARGRSSGLRPAGVPPSAHL